MLRRLRGRFGIAAPQVAIRTHVPWYLRAVSVVVVVALLLGLAIWVFDAGRRIAGFDQGELSTLQTANAALEEEVARLRSLLAASENNLQIELAAQKQLSEKHSVLIEESAKLKEELAVLERLSRQRVKIENQ
jgi:cell shape-determining protein MreC